MLHERIRRARALKGMTLQEVADQMGVFPSRLFPSTRMARMPPIPPD